jgi:putative ABC transport system ATP-binding protein
MQISIHNLYKSYGNTEILAKLNLEIAQGDFISIVGKSGSGKSTLLNIIGLLDNDFQGNYIFNERSVAKLHEDNLSSLRNQSFGFIFQSYHLLPYMSVLDNILLPTLYEKRSQSQRFRRMSDDTLNEFLEEMELLPLKHKQVQLLSGGEKQRVAILRSIIMQPQVVLADEPTGNLDPENANLIFGILKKLNKMGITIVLVTHNHELALRAGRMLHLENGKLHEK